ncbi:MAG: UvrABC system protein B [Chlamydiae bacterium]|nr:UvrABC system protein B [Chlamydiota bacterium]
MKAFQLVTTYEPRGDQPTAIQTLVDGLNEGKESQALLGITGSGKTFTMANVIEKVNRPTLILAHNKTLAAQLYSEFKAYFPENAVEYFVSYYDYYQPEAYIARSDTFIEKDMSINDRIDRLRLSATRSLLERRDVIIVASVSCIYGLGVPEYYAEMNVKIEKRQMLDRDAFLLSLVAIHYKRNDYDFKRGTFRIRGESIEIFPAYEEDMALRIEFFGDEVDQISHIDPLTGMVLKHENQVVLFPASHFVTPENVRKTALLNIKQELSHRVDELKREEKLLETERILQRTHYDLELIKEMGFCKGIENYSRHFSNRLAGSPPPCLLNYFPDDFLLFVDESHQSIPQIRAMYNGDKARKTSLVDYGFRLPSAYDNRPLKFEEFYKKIGQRIYVSATPSDWELGEVHGEVVTQIIRPTGLLDPKIEVRPASNQVDNVLEEIRVQQEKDGRVLVTTLTKRLSEDLAKYLVELGIKAKYLHSDIDTFERMQIIQDLRAKKFDVLIGINLLREGLDIPEVSLVAILDADKEGFLRSETALLQTCGRAARNSEGRVIMYADKITSSIQKTLDVTNDRRKQQMEYNKRHNIVPKTIKKGLFNIFPEEMEAVSQSGSKKKHVNIEDIRRQIKNLENDMRKKANKLEFEEAAKIRDEMKRLQKVELSLS